MFSPSDNTAVFRMERDFDAFLSANNRQKSGPRMLNLNKSGDEEESSSMSVISVKSLIEKEKEDKLRKAEVIAAKSTITKLEMELNSMRTSNKRARIEYERDIDKVKSEHQRESDKIAELKSQLQYVSEKEKAARDELYETREASEKKQAACEEKLLTLQKDKLQLEDDLQQTKEQSWEKITELKNQVMRTNMELSICRSELEETKAQLKLQLKRSSETTLQLQELEGFKLRNIQLEQKIKDLEKQLCQHGDDMVVTKALRVQLDKVPDLEKQLEKLQEENKYYKETEKNTYLLEEQIDGLTKKLQRCEERMADYTQLQLDNESLKISLEKWQGKDTGGLRRPQSPSELAHQVATLQSAHVLAHEEQCKLQSRLNSSQNEIQDVSVKYQNAVQEVGTAKVASQQQQDLIKRLQRKLLLVSKERESYKRILDSYESELTVNTATLQTGRVQQLEQLVQDYRTQNEMLEAELGKTAEQVKNTLSMKGDGKADPSEELLKQNLIRDLKGKIVELEVLLQKKTEEKDILEARIEQRNLQGDYDPTKTKVVHFTLNPAEQAQKRREEELRRLTEENDRLKHRLQLLEESGGAVEDLTLEVEKKLEQPDAAKELDELKTQLTREELRNKRLMEAFKKTSQEFREVCYQLTGYKIDIPCADRYRLTNMYAESQQDYLLFSHSSAGETQMLQTPFSETIQELIHLHLIEHDSIPAFLSSVTLELFKRRTLCVE